MLAMILSASLIPEFELFFSYEKNPDSLPLGDVSQTLL